MQVALAGKRWQEYKPPSTSSDQITVLLRADLAICLVK